MDQRTTRSYHQFGQPWLVISPGGRQVSATEERRITIHTAVTLPKEYPGRPAVRDKDLLGQSISTLSGRRGSGRRADGRAFTTGDQGSMLSFMIAWPYRCAGGSRCPEAAPWRVLQLDVEGTGKQAGLKVRALARQLVESIRPITNALPPAGSAVPEEPGLFADDMVVLGRGGQGDHAWEVRGPQGLRPGLLDRGFGSEAVAKVVVELPDQSALEVPTFRRKGFPFTFFVLPPLPPDAVPRSVASFDDRGRPLGRTTSYGGYPGGCR